MSRTPPFRGRPNLHLALTNLTGSPHHPRQYTPGSSTGSTPFATPLAITAYSPFRSAGLKPPTPYGGPMDFTPRRSENPGHFGQYVFSRLRYLLSSRLLWVSLVLGALMLWWFNGGSEDLDLVRVGAAGLGKDFFQEGITRNLQFFPATNPKIHVRLEVVLLKLHRLTVQKYTGRWTATPNRLRKDGAFPGTNPQDKKAHSIEQALANASIQGVYFDVTVKNTTTILLSLHNADEQDPANLISIIQSDTTKHLPLPTPGHVSFRPSSNEKPAPPVSLLARVDQDEYVLLPNASALVSICSRDLEIGAEHHLRIVAPMTDDHGRGIVELEGIWLSKGGKLLRVEGSLLSEEYADEDALQAENDQIGERHRTGLSGLAIGDDHSKSDHLKSSDNNDELPIEIQERKKILEVITDSPGSLCGRQRGRRTGGADGLLAGVMGWEYLLGEMFGADHVGIGVDGMCLTQGCIGGAGQPAGIGDVFFRSGPYGSAYFEHPWMFNAYVPDVIVLNMGGADDTSFEKHGIEYEKSMWELSEDFESTYVSLIKAIRSLAYPKHPVMVHGERSGSSSFIPNAIPVSIPIFVMRPLRGQLEHATQNVVARLRADGDKTVFWLDTSGWLDLDTEDSEIGDFFLDDTASPAKWRLTEQGNQRVAIFLHTHVCRYLAGAEEKCAFLPHEVYQGKVFNPEEADFDRYLENEKERKLRKLFWEDHTNEAGKDDEGILIH